MEAERDRAKIREGITGEESCFALTRTIWIYIVGVKRLGEK